MAQLGRVRERVKYVVGRQLIDKALAEAAERRGLSPEALEEIAVPTFGLDAGDTLRRTIADGVVEIRITGSHEVTLSWQTADGKSRKSIPAAVRQDHPAALAELKKTVKAITSVLPAQKARLERLLVSDRFMPMADWCTRYVDHPLVGEMARRLIWRFSEGDDVALGAIDGGRVVGAHDQPIPWLTPRDERALLASARDAAGGDPGLAGLA